MNAGSDADGYKNDRHNHGDNGNGDPPPDHEPHCPGHTYTHREQGNDDAQEGAQSPVEDYSNDHCHKGHKFDQVLLHDLFCEIEDVGIPHHVDFFRACIALHNGFNLAHEIVAFSEQSWAVQLQEQGRTPPIRRDQAPRVGTAQDVVSKLFNFLRSLRKIQGHGCDLNAKKAALHLLGIQRALNLHYARQGFQLTGEIMDFPQSGRTEHVVALHSHEEKILGAEILHNFHQFHQDRIVLGNHGIDTGIKGDAWQEGCGTYGNQYHDSHHHPGVIHN